VETGRRRGNSSCVTTYRADRELLWVLHCQCQVGMVPQVGYVDAADL
jgi:hypothetical protein